MAAPMSMPTRYAPRSQPSARKCPIALDCNAYNTRGRPP
jgi:hypothetical protein